MKITYILIFAGGTAALINNQGCLEWCKTNYGILGLATCYTPSIFGQGPCFDCGPHKSVQTKELCQKKCVNLNTDNNNCGKCGNKCTGGSSCDGGICRPQTTCKTTEACSVSPPCPDSSCVCQPDERGGGTAYCNKPAFCSELTNCNTIKDCPIAGSVCLSTCCSGSAKCFPPDRLCTKPASRIFKPRHIEEVNVDELYDALDEAISNHSPEGRDIVARQNGDGEWSGPVRPKGTK